MVQAEPPPAPVKRPGARQVETIDSFDGVQNLCIFEGNQDSAGAQGTLPLTRADGLPTFSLKERGPLLEEFAFEHRLTTSLSRDQFVRIWWEA